MKATQTLYDFHGLVSLSVVDHRPGLSLFAEAGQPFTHFQVQSLAEAPQVVLEMGGFQPQPGECYLVDHKYHIRENYIYCQEQWRSFRWQVEIEGFESGPTHIHLDLRGGGLRQILIPGMYANGLLTRQVIGRHLHDRGCALLHAAAAARSGKAVVAFGRGGSYKTSLLMSLLRSAPDWRTLGDDGLILQGAEVLSFPTFPALFAYRLKHLEGEELGFGERAGYLASLLKPGYHADIYAPRAEIAALVEVVTGDFEQVVIKETPFARNLAGILHESRLEEHNSVNLGFNDSYPQMVEAYSYIFPGNGLQTTWPDQEGQMAAADGAGSYQVCLPLKPGPGDLQDVVGFLNEIVPG